MVKIIKITCNGPARHVNDVDIDKLLKSQSVLKETAPSSGSTIPSKLVLPCQKCIEGKVIITRKIIESFSSKTDDLYKFFMEQSHNPPVKEMPVINTITNHFPLKVDKISIEYLKIVNIKCFEQIEINFDSPDNNALIIGTNATGKSTILQLLASGLRGIQGVPFPYNWKKVVKTGKNTSSFEIALKRTLHASNQSIDQPIDQLINLKFEIDENDTITCIKGKDKLDAIIKNQLLILGYGAGRQIKLEYPAPYKDIEPVATLFGENGYLKHIKVSENYKYVSENFHLIQPLVNAILDKADYKNKVLLADYDTSSLYFKTPSNPDELIPTEALSEGFKSTFVWLFDMIIRIVEKGGDIGNAHEIPGIVLLDEIDLHLHPLWQRTILPGIEELFPNIQFIATTHSPFVVQTVKNENLIILESDENSNNVKAVNKDITSELSYSAIVREIFGIQSPFSFDTEQEMNEFRKMRDAILRNEEIDEEKFKKTVLELAGKGLEIESVMRREIRQLERHTGKIFDIYE
jgi:predicted ATP-binding protein involved in virulence